MPDAKTQLLAPLQQVNDAVPQKLAGLDEWDLRRPLTPTGSNLLGIVKHLATVQVGYFGAVFGRPWPEPTPWLEEGSELNEDMYAAADETSEWVIDFHRRTWAHAQETLAVTDLDTTGTVAWWPEDHRHPTLRAVVAHMTAEAARHAGHLDILRESIDGEAGRFPGDPSMPGARDLDWPAYVAKVEAAARAASGR